MTQGLSQEEFLHYSGIILVRPAIQDGSSGLVVILRSEGSKSRTEGEMALMARFMKADRGANNFGTNALTVMVSKKWTRE